MTCKGNKVIKQRGVAESDDTKRRCHETQSRLQEMQDGSKTNRFFFVLVACRKNEDLIKGCMGKTQNRSYAEIMVPKTIAMKCFELF